MSKTSDSKLTVNTALSTIHEIHGFFKQPQNNPLFQVADSRTLYAWQNVSRFYPTSQILRDGPISRLTESINPDIGEATFSRSPGGKQETVNSYFDESPLDSLLVIHQGKIVLERYKTMRPFDKHQWFSSGKVVPGSMIALLEEQGKIDIHNPVSTYVQELKGSAWDSVTVEETLDMTTGLDSTEHEEPNDDARINPIRGWYKWAVSIGLFEDKDNLNQTPYDVMGKMKRVKAGFTAFEYNSINTFALELIVEKVTGKPMNEVVSERVWRKAGMEADAFERVTEDGLPLGWGFFNCRLRDFARFGMLFTPSWNTVSEEQIFPDSVLKKIQKGGHPEIYTKGSIGQQLQNVFPDIKGLSNHYQWDVIFPDGDILKLGVGGQVLYVSPARDAVVVDFCTGKNEDGHHNARMARTIATNL